MSAASRSAAAAAQVAGRLLRRARPADAVPPAERLEILLRADGPGYDLRSRSSPGRTVATAPVGPDLVLLDALLRHDAEGHAEVWISLFDVALQRGCVASLAPDGPGGPTPLPRFEGPPGSVLWWLRDRGGVVEVRDVRTGCTFRLGPDGPERVAYGGPPRESAAP